MIKQVHLKNGQKVKIRHVQETDMDEFWNNFNEVVDEGTYLPVFYPVRSDLEKKAFYDNIVKNNELCIVAELTKRIGKHSIVGQCEITNLEWDASDHVGNLGIIVKKGYRNLGLGFHLIDTVILEAKNALNKEKIILSCFSTNKRALHLYAKMGFKTVGTRKRQFYMNSQYYDEVLMELWIDDYLEKREKETV